MDSTICWLLLCVLFCLQAEDGIRDLVRSRGLGDVYKRQVFGLLLAFFIAGVGGLFGGSVGGATLPTIGQGKELSLIHI